ncbi:HTH-type transcriptional activator Btr [compost metagenome]
MNKSEQIAKYIYKIEDVKRKKNNNISSLTEHTRLYTLLFMLDASGEIEIDGLITPLHSQQVLVLPPGTSVKYQAPRNSRIDYYDIQFHALHQDEQGCFVPADVHFPKEISISNYHFLLGRLAEMENCLNNGDPWDAMKGNLIFQEILMVLFKDALHKEHPDRNQMVNKAIDYMEQNYPYSIHRDKLATMAGVSPDYFTRVFKKTTGKSPVEYLNEIRIKHAKQLLLSTNDSMRSIAQNVGFSDEFYFSRKFKSMSGKSPMLYIKSIKQTERIASLKPLLTGHLLALGIQPYAAVINRAYPMTEGLNNTINIGELAPNLEKLMSVKPALILTTQYRDFDKSSKEKIYDHIAPTVTLPFFEPWRVHLQTIAKLVGKEQEAYDWLRRYELKCDQIRDRVHRKMGADSLLIIGIGKNKLCVYGQRNLGAVLYGDLQLSIPQGVEKISHYKEIEPEELQQFQADRILLTSHKHDGTIDTDESIARRVSMLFDSDQWRSLKAVKEGSVYSMYNSRHLYTCYTSLSHNLLLDQVQLLL